MARITEGKYLISKVIAFLVVMCFAVICGQTCASAEAGVLNHKKVAILVIGSNEFKTDRYFELMETAFGKNITQALYGNDVQAMYQKYWLEKSGQVFLML